MSFQVCENCDDEGDDYEQCPFCKDHFCGYEDCCVLNRCIGCDKKICDECTFFYKDEEYCEKCEIDATKQCTTCVRINCKRRCYSCRGYNCGSSYSTKDCGFLTCLGCYNKICKMCCNHSTCNHRDGSGIYCYNCKDCNEILFGHGRYSDY